ncbi:hypothetical protein V1L52_11155 [Treponema sp. HNW]|uniref:hypothetical protein n=1 Tax=Treponema sp. HNW TaxID=3116654 RepID=UPI003D13DB71
MSVFSEFENDLYSAAESKSAWLDSIGLPKLVDEYRNYRSVFNTVLSLLLKKGFIETDPYKVDKKITDIKIPEKDDFQENDRTAAFSIRLSEYESTLEFLCNYFKFSVETLTMDTIKKLIQLNNYISWNSLMSASAKNDSRRLGEIFATIKSSSDPLSTSVLNDSTNFISKSLARINTMLKEITEFQKEMYKVQVRKKVLDSAAFAAKKTSFNSGNGLHMIKEHFASAMGKQPFYTELIEEIVKEETSPDKERRQDAVLSKLRMQDQEKEKKRPEVNTKKLLLSAVQLFGALAPQYTQAAPKIEENHYILQSEHTGFWEKLKAAFRKAFNIPEKPIEYKIKLTDNSTQTVKTETVNYSSFIDNLMKRTRLYASFAVSQSPNLYKLAEMDENFIFDYLQRQLSECYNLQLQMEGLDEFFKTAANAANRSKIKGIQIELTSLKNTLIKINQRKAEYASYIAEQIQLQKLGIQNV